jgi:hypothetical protein
MTGHVVEIGKRWGCAKRNKLVCLRIDVGLVRYSYIPAPCLKLLPPEEEKRKPKVGDVVDVRKGMHDMPREKLTVKELSTYSKWEWFARTDGGDSNHFNEEDIIKYHN